MLTGDGKMGKRFIFNATQRPRGFLLARLHSTGVKNARAQRGIDFRSGAEAHQDRGPPHTHRRVHTRVAVNAPAAVMRR